MCKKNECKLKLKEIDLPMNVREKISCKQNISKKKKKIKQEILFYLFILILISVNFQKNWKNH